MSRILMAEDEQRISSFVEKGLRAAGYEVETVADGVSAMAEVRGGGFDLVLLDIGLPRLDGFEVLRMLRAEGIGVPVIILTARDSGRDTVAGLESGANDYMAKPFRFDELLARIRARLRDAMPTTDVPLLVAGDLELDVRGRRITVGGATIELSAREFALAEEFLRNPDRVLSRDELLRTVWGYDHDPGTNVVDVYVRYLRNKIGVGYFQTVRGLGYRFAPLGGRP
ncbi:MULTISPECIES: response regulator transcription factor [unclassified Leifsonia]|uniref:response regulator transcription factor n=1 Tax=unclassified Leifsonia TaxID=2663824 RepID=UPI0006FE2F6C|nr:MULTISPECIES: response regulator transcription factor [unclassified Leifsonia]KQX06546.1 two-component system response regulator [Leifsonia sp. Root1293]KRA10830.1 two-component system response regulator [Leifsonia sp. Root60]